MDLCTGVVELSTPLQVVDASLSHRKLSVANYRYPIGEGWGKFLAQAGLFVLGGAIGLPMLGEVIGGLGAAGAGGFGGAGGVTAASLGELGLNTALAAGTPGGIASGLSAASLGELGINTALAAGSEGGIAAGTALSGVEAAPSFFESLNLGKSAFPNAPGYVQQGVNRFGTGLITSGGDP